MNHQPKIKFQVPLSEHLRAWAREVFRRPACEPRERLEISVVVNGVTIRIPGYVTAFSIHQNASRGECQGLDTLELEIETMSPTVAEPEESL